MKGRNAKNLVVILAKGEFPRRAVSDGLVARCSWTCCNSEPGSFEPKVTDAAVSMSSGFLMTFIGFRYSAGLQLL